MLVEWSSMTSDGYFIEGDGCGCQASSCCLLFPETQN